MEKAMFAPCGIDCAECASYKVTASGDLNAAGLLVDWYRSRGWIGADEGAEAVADKAPLCRGCMNANADSFFKCGCRMLVCCKDKRIENCGECERFPCDDYKDFARGNEVHKRAMDYLTANRLGDRGNDATR